MSVLMHCLYLAVLGLHCCTRAFSSCGEPGAPLWLQHDGFASRGLLLLRSTGLGAWASVAVAPGLSGIASRAPEGQLSSCSAWAQLPHGIWDLSGSGTEPVSLALQADPQSLDHQEAQGGFLLKVPKNHPPKPSPEACPGVFRRPAWAPALSPTHWKTGHLPAGPILGAARWSWDFPSGASGKEPACQCRRLKRHRFDPWVGKIFWRWAWQPTPVFLPGESHGQRNLASYSP